MISRQQRYIMLLLASILVFASCGKETNIEKIATSLEDRLRNAIAGDIVEAENGTYYGSFLIPAGVTLKAKENGKVLLVYDEAGFVVKMETGGDIPTKLLGVAIESQADVALMLVGAGEAEIKDSSIVCYRSFGLLADSLSSLTLNNLDLQAQVSDLSALSYPIDPALYPAIGLITSGIGNFTAEALTVSSFAGFAAIFSETSGQWLEGAVMDSIGVGILVEKGSMQFNGISISNIKNCINTTCSMLNQVYGLAAVNGAALITDGLIISDNDGIGLFQDHSGGAHSNLSVENNSMPGVWLQDVGASESTSFSISGSENSLASNGGAGLVAHRSGRISLSETQVSSSFEIPITKDDSSSEFWADGLQLVDLNGDVSLQNLTLNDNARIGLLLSGVADTQPEITITDVTITGNGRYGFRAQSGMISNPEWQDQMTIDETLKNNDAALTIDLAVSDILSLRPSAAAISEKGLIGDNGLIDTEGRPRGEEKVNANGELSF